MSEPFRLKARWVLPVDRPPIENGVVEVVDGLITAVRSAIPHEQCCDAGDVLMPGLVNAHVHLEFSLVERPFLPARPFAEWIRALVAYRRRELAPGSPGFAEAFLKGLIDSGSGGATLLGEIATTDWDAMRVPPDPSRLVAFRELIGLRATVVESQLKLAERWLALDAPAPGPPRRNVTLGVGDPFNVEAIPPYSLLRPIRGLSPHAPYSVSPELLQRTVELAKRCHAPVAMHLAETREELEFLQTGCGELAEMLKSFGAWSDEDLFVGRRPLDILRVLSDAPRVLVVHGNYLAEDEIDFIAARPQMSVVYCPRTHEFFGHEPHPWRQLLAKGANVALGTDGRGSNPDLSLWNELVFLRQRFPDVAPSTLLELGTLAGARALGCDHECGSLTVGKRADLLEITLDNAEFRRNPLEALFDGPRKNWRVMVAEELE